MKEFGEKGFTHLVIVHPLQFVIPTVKKIIEKRILPRLTNERL
jgi:isoprenylcysteine carboxyl methyltransferase (ICMT) family protein YpbQ